MSVVFSRLAPSLALAGMLLVPAPAATHHAQSGWAYPDGCCSPDNGCEDLTPGRVQIVPGGFLLDGKFFIPQEGNPEHVAPYVDYSGDDLFHACWSPIRVERIQGPRCFFWPKPKVS